MAWEHRAVTLPGTGQHGKHHKTECHFAHLAALLSPASPLPSGPQLLHLYNEVAPHTQRPFLPLIHSDTPISIKLVIPFMM